MTPRTIVLGDLAALFAFALLGLASHEHEVTVAALVRTFLPFAAAWLLIGLAAGVFAPGADGRPAIGGRVFAAYLVAGVIALGARSVIFDRTLFNAFFLIAMIGNGLFLFGWRLACVLWLRRRPPSTPFEEATGT